MCLALFSEQMAAVFSQQFGAQRVIKTPAVMGGEDFGRYYHADKRINSLIFWVGGVPQQRWDEAQQNGSRLPSLHSPFWTPDAEAVISTATQALSRAALEIMQK
jgi:hippurate hydrolase